MGMYVHSDMSEVIKGGWPARENLIYGHVIGLV